MNKSILISLICLIGMTKIMVGQEKEPSKLDFGGYASFLQSVMFDSIQGNWTCGNLIHNRLNFKYYPSKTITATIEMRNRLAFGENVKLNPNAAATYKNDYGILNLTTNIASGKSYVFNSSLDRFWFAYEKNKWRITLGRQRINWSQTWVWNPNDIFNAYSFFDFDYAERPGSDALRIQYYNTEVSTSELAVKMNNQKQITAAGYYKFNKWDYDFQILGGILNNTDYVIGAGWAGAIKQLAVRGEISYFKPVKHFQEPYGLCLASVAMDYTFGNSLTIMSEFLYNSSVNTTMDNYMSVYSAPLSVKNLSFVKYNLLLQATYPITSLITGSLAGMYFPPVKGYYLGPNFSYSASDNIELSVYLQSFGGKINTDSGEKELLRFNILYLRSKISF